MRGIALWLLGVPVGVIILLYLFHIILVLLAEG